MALKMESCSIEELCPASEGGEKLLLELRHRLEEWLKFQPHLPQDIPKQILEYFILGTKMSLEQAKQKLDMFYTLKKLVPEVLANRDPRGSGLTRFHKMMRTVYLPKLTPEKYRVCIFQPFVDDYTDFNSSDDAKYALMIEEILMLDIEARSLGSIYVYDQSKITFALVAKYTPALIKKFEIIATKAYAKKIKGIHLINAAPLTDTLVALGKKALKPKLAARITVHQKGSYESLYQVIPKSILPKDYGGDEQSMEHLDELWRQKVDEKRDWFLDQDKIVVDEKLRPGPPMNADELFGFSGSFRKLDVD
ncbi:retinol-binding protein pinta-like [Neodiprion virginianus]|uniref:retinol-binding protein pinta-like n=1 Tax=Neodiprion virginianus TaxID=2961670 RepID=UPI001EE6C13B|nr:retinol-binding protein pinta-like [Neodiprion virginianus]XP_046608739.1 retinol-binding protein pinta-like [Neodiprion virginianus]